ncbi:hypothetical protein AB9T88_09580 [Flavobacterium sp. LBUM151]
MKKYEIKGTVKNKPITFTLTIDKNLDEKALDLKNKEIHNVDAQLFKETNEGGTAIFSIRKSTAKECIADLLIYGDKNDIKFPNDYLVQIGNEEVFIMAKILK